jgi:hypothetical protein
MIYIFMRVIVSYEFFYIIMSYKFVLHVCFDPIAIARFPFWKQSTNYTCLCEVHNAIHHLWHVRLHGLNGPLLKKRVVVVVPADLPDQEQCSAQLLGTICR